MSNVARKRHVYARVCVRILATVAGVPLVLLVSNGLIADMTGRGDGTGDTAVADSARSFTIEGKATKPISPGVSRSLDLTLTNPQGFPVTVTGLKVSVRSVRAPRADRAHPCGLRDFVIDQAASSRKIILPKRTASTLSTLGLARATWPRVGMRNRPVNQDGCKGASLTLAYTASGTWARR